MKIGNTNTEENNMILITNTKTKVQYTCEDSQLERACIEIAGGGYDASQVGDAMLACSDFKQNNKATLKGHTIEPHNG
jgi:hypothetical protein